MNTILCMHVSKTLRLYIRARMYLCVDAHVRMCIRMCMYMYRMVYADLEELRNVCVRVCMCTCTCIFIFECIHSAYTYEKVLAAAELACYVMYTSCL